MHLFSTVRVDKYSKNRPFSTYLYQFHLSLEMFSQSVEMGYNELIYFTWKNLLLNTPHSLSELIVVAHFSHSLKERQKKLLLYALHSFVLRCLCRGFKFSRCLHYT